MRYTRWGKRRLICKILKRKLIAKSVIFAIRWQLKHTARAVALDYRKRQN